ncbi:DUF2214 family protein [Mesorhizobium sp. RP14(2022)]|uniref:DUF2214 family protein n=1 Tax=Mesorhizobium liriopis TaxID=2953882 RepID=A0ABT1C6I2_9HYPH|nr:DUF2214 family protein [Mesorhizobium liriopis]MCO6050426.1 DUF2214 family protein [Mesorhizobium liriopis]
MLLDWTLASLHHLLVFPLFAVFVAEAALLRAGLSGPSLGRLARLDMFYGILSVLVIAVGVLRVIYGLKGWEYYAANHAFWGKMAAFALVGILSIWPSKAIVRWRKNQSADPAYSVSAEEIRHVRRFVHFQALFFAMIVIFAAAMARNIGG